MKKMLSFILAAAMLLALAACGNSAPGETPSPEVIAPTEEPAENPDEAALLAQEEAELAAKTAEIDKALQGVWKGEILAGTTNVLTFTDGRILANVFLGGVDYAGNEGSYTIGASSIEVSYDHSSEIVEFSYTYENGELLVFMSGGYALEKYDAAKISEELAAAYDAENWSAVISLATELKAIYPDAQESEAATSLLLEAREHLEAAAQAALSRLTTDYDKVQALTWYTPKNAPQYDDERTNFHVYIGRLDAGETWLRMRANYTADDWIFFESIIYSIDGQNQTKYLSRSDYYRDNAYGNVWEVADYEPSDSDVKMLESIINSEETIIRFQGDNYHYDHIVTQAEKDALRDVLTAFYYLSSQAQ